MTTVRATTGRPDHLGVGHMVTPWLTSLLVGTGLAAIVASRWLATIRGLDPLAVGAAFGVALASLWFTAARPSRWKPWIRFGGSGPHLAFAVAAGTAFGLALVGLAVVGPAIGGSPVLPGLGRPAAPFPPWAAIIVVVAVAEEGILRGVLFDRLRGAGGLLTAVAVTTAVFALMHVPLYGWHVVPLDLAVGLALAGLRLSTGTVLAPAIAHAVADLATWWL